MSIADKIIRNTTANAIGKIFDMAMLLIITPFIFKYLGTELYGLWAIIFVLSGYISFFDFGIGQSFVKFIAEHHAKNDSLTINKILSTGFFFYLLLGVILVTLVYFSLDAIVLNLFKIPPQYGDVAKTSILLAFTVMCVSNVFSCFSGLLNGLQRMDLRNGIMIIARIISFIGAFIVIYYDWGIVGITIRSCISMIVAMVLWIFIGKKIFPQLKISPFLVNRRMFKDLFNYGYKLQVTLIGEISLQSIIPVIISNILGLAYVAYYSLAFKIFRVVRMIPILSLGPLIPAVAELNARGRKDLIDKIFYTGSKYLSFLTSYFVFGAATTFSYFLYLWLSIKQPEIIYAFYVLVIVAGLHTVLTGIVTSILRGTGKPKYEMQHSIIVFLATIILGIILSKIFGFAGILLAVLIANVAGSIYFYLIFHKLHKINPLSTLKKITLFPFLLSLTLFGLFQWIILVFDLTSPLKMTNFIYFMFFGLSFSLMYFVFTFLLRYFTQEEIDYLKRKILQKWPLHEK